MDTQQSLIADIEAAASILGIKPSTVGERAGQGGKFYARLKDGARVWPETAASVRDRIKALIEIHNQQCEPSHLSLQGNQTRTQREMCVKRTKVAKQSPEKSEIVAGVGQ